MLLLVVPSASTRGSEQKLEDRRLFLNTSTSMMCGLLEHWHKLSRMVVESPPSKFSKAPWLSMDETSWPPEISSNLCFLCLWFCEMSILLTQISWDVPSHAVLDCYIRVLPYFPLIFSIIWWLCLLDGNLMAVAEELGIPSGTSEMLTMMLYKIWIPENFLKFLVIRPWFKPHCFALCYAVDIVFQYYSQIKVRFNSTKIYTYIYWPSQNSTL